MYGGGSTHAHCDESSGTDAACTGRLGGGGARKLQEDTLTVKRCVLGPEHSSTTISAWNLFQTLQDLGERAAALAIPERDLLWLLDRDPATLGANQRKIREDVVRHVKKSG